MKKSVILAAGKGTRMESDLPKVVHKLCGREMINRVLDASKEAGVDEDIVVIGYKGDIVKEAIDRDVDFVVQEEQLGTGHAVMMARDLIKEDDTVIVLCGDSPLIKASTIKEIFDFNEKTNAEITLCTAVYDETPAYGRIVKDENDEVVKVVEHKDATDEEKMIKEVNVGFGIYSGKALLATFDKLDCNNAAHEYYLTDVPRLAHELGMKVNTFELKDKDEGFGPNNKADLAKAEEIFNNRK